METTGNVLWRSSKFNKEFANVGINAYIDNLAKEIKAEIQNNNFKVDKKVNIDNKIYHVIGEFIKMKKKDRKKETPMSDQLKAQKYMCRNYYDVRTFGAVMSTGNNPCGIVRGPVQLNFARSIDPVLAEDITITRQAKTTIDRQEKGMTEIGKKSLVYYGLYRAEGYISASLAQRVTGFGEEDLELLWTAIINMFENDHSAARGKMCMRKLYVFRHDSVLGNAPSHVLFDKITVTKKADVVTPRKFSDYTIAVDRQLPDGVTLLEKI